MPHLKFLFVLKMISVLLLIICGAMLVPTGMAVYYKEFAAVEGFIATICGVSILCGLYLLLTRKDKNKDFSVRDGFLFVTLSWLSVTVVGALPCFLSGSIPLFTDAFFESMSGFSTTGATILTDIESLPKSVLFWRALAHWLGGMGIVVLTVAVFPLMGIGGLQLIRAEAPGPTVDRLTPRIAETAKILWLIYIAFTAVETILLMLCGVDAFNAITHSFSTISTGGLSPLNDSVGHFNSSKVDWIVTLFMFLSGVNFALHYRLFAGRSLSVFKDTELRIFICVILAAAGLVCIDLYKHVYGTFEESLRYALFQVTSIITTTGLTTANYDLWPNFSKVILLGLCFIGACSGSTGGGIKVMRIAILFKQAINEIKLLLHPRGVFVLRTGGGTVAKHIVYAISGFFFIYIANVLIVTFVVATSGADILTSLSAALATVGCVGIGFGEINPASNYAFFPNYVKWVLSFAMLIGRLELYTVLVLFTPWFWKR